MSWNTVCCRDKAIWLLLFLLSGLFQLHEYADHLLKNLFVLFQHTVDGISHKSLRKYHSLNMSGFIQWESFIFCQGCVKRHAKDV